MANGFATSTIKLPDVKTGFDSKGTAIVPVTVGKGEKKIGKIGDLERLISKVATLRINPRECSRLKDALIALKPIKDICSKSGKVLKNLTDKIKTCDSIKDKIERELSDTPPMLMNKGNVIKQGVSTELDDLRSIQN